MKCRNAQMLLWRFLICIPISGKQLYFTFTCEASLVACLSLGTGVLSWSLPRLPCRGHFLGHGGVLRSECTARAVSKLWTVLCSPSCYALSCLVWEPPTAWRCFYGISAELVLFLSPEHSSGGLGGCCYVPKETRLLVFFHSTAMVLLGSSDGRWASLGLTASGCIRCCSLKYRWAFPHECCCCISGADD